MFQITSSKSSISDSEGYLVTMLYWLDILEEPCPLSMDAQGESMPLNKRVLHTSFLGNLCLYFWLLPIIYWSISHIPNITSNKILLLSLWYSLPEHDWAFLTKDRMIISSKILNFWFCFLPKSFSFELSLLFLFYDNSKKRSQTTPSTLCLQILSDNMQVSLLTINNFSTFCPTIIHTKLTYIFCSFYNTNFYQEL